MKRLLCLFSALLLGSAVLAQDDNLTAEESPTHVEIDPIKFELGPSGKLETMAMDSQGRLLAGISWVPGGEQSTDRRTRPAEGRRPPQRGPGARPGFNQPDEERKYAIRVISPEGQVVESWPLIRVEPRMIHATEDGEVYVAGDHRIVRFDKKGRQQAYIEISDVMKGRFDGAHSSGITANEQYVFMAFGHGHSLRATEDIVRFDRDLMNPKVIAEQQFGCCSHIDLECRSGELLIAENSRHRVNRYSFEGEFLGRWGRRDREGLEGFAACCNPVNVDLGSDGILWTAESGIGRVKKYRPDGEFLGLVGYVDTTKFDRGSRLAAMSCYIPIEVSADGSHVYIMDVRQHFIRVLERSENAPVANE